MSIFIPNTIIAIGEYAFTFCNELTIHCETASKPSEWSDCWNKLDPFSSSSYVLVVWDYKENQ